MALQHTHATEQAHMQCWCFSTVFLSVCLMMHVYPAAALEHICQLWGIPTSEAVMVGDSAKVRESRSTMSGQSGELAATRGCARCRALARASHAPHCQCMQQCCQARGRTMW